MTTRVKICGITALPDALAAVEAGADVLGFVFAVSTRQVTPAVARKIIEQLPSHVQAVGVFRDLARSRLEDAVAASGIDTVQLHGSETPSYCRRVARPVWKRLAVLNGDTPRSLRERAAGFPVAACLLDPGAGDGRTYPWVIGRSIELPLVVAGGLTPDNVSEAIRESHPYAVDVSSGVEDRPGHKDPQKIGAFVQAVRSTDAELATR